MQHIYFNMGRRQFRSGYAGGSQQALRADFNDSMAQILANLNSFIDGLDSVTPELVVEALQPTFDKSQNLVPVKTGALKESGYLQARKLTRGAEAEMGYGLYGQPDYTIFVHEMPYNHQAPTSDKFLERPVLEDYNEFPERIASLVREAVGQ